MKLYKILLTALVLAVSTLSFAQGQLKGKVVDTDGEPIVGANLRWKNTSTGGVTNVDGEFNINTSQVSNKLIASYIGHTPDTITVKNPAEFLNITLKGEVSLDEVLVTARRQGTMNSRVDAMQSQKITYEELCRAACCNLAESFETNASVDVAYSDAATGARQIKLLGLSGTYVQMLTEQIPNLQGAASPYGLSYVPGPWMEGIQVSKGTSSVKNGYEALTGQINIDYKKPQTADPLFINLFAAHTGRLEGNMDVNFNLNKKLATGLLLHYSREKMSHDSDDDGFLDMPKTEQFNVMNRWYYKSDNYIFQAGANFVHESRESGQIGHNSHIENPYKIDITTNRGLIFTKNGYIFNHDKNTNMALILSGTYHDQKSNFGHTLFNVDQQNIYANLMFETEFDSKNRISTGVSVNYDNYNEKLRDEKVEGLDNIKLKRNDAITGAYAQYTFDYYSRFTLLAGIRGDYSQDHGFFATPRLHVKYNPWGDLLGLRASVGRGYRIANVLVENSYLLASSRTMVFEKGLDNFESAWNYGASAHLTLPLFGKDLSVMLEYYYTDFDKQVVANLEDPTRVTFSNLDGRSFAQNAQIEVSYPFFKGFLMTGAYRWTDAKTTYDGKLMTKPLTNRYKGLITASYQTPGGMWQFDATSQFNGGGRMPNPGTVDPLWKPDFPSYVSLSAQATFNYKELSVYVGGENLTGYRQKNPIIDAANPWGENSRFDASMVWGPVHGPKFYVGLRWSIPKV